MKKIKELLCLLIIFAVKVKSIDERGCKGLMELVVIIDGSDSINEPDYNSLKVSMTKLVQSLDIQETEIRISFVVFSSNIALETPLVGNKPQALQTAATLPHPRDGTNTWMALEAMLDIVTKDRRPDVPVVGVVLTDGISKNKTKTKNAANALKDIGVTMYSIGVTDIKNKQELNDIASAPENVITFQTFEELALKLESLVKLVCPKCPPNPLLPHSLTVPGDYIVDTVVEYHCMPDFVPVGNNKITCQRDQTWTKLEYACLSDCGDPPVLEHTALTLPGRLEGSKTKYQCERGSVLEGTPETVCQEDGTWSRPTFKCRADCGLPTLIKYSTLSPGGNLQGDKRTYTCASSTVQEGNPVIECLSSGMWSQTNLYCRPICGEPPMIDRAVISAGGIVEGARRTYTCYVNTVTEGNTMITCGPTGKWSVTNLYCRPDCGPPPMVERAVIHEYLNTIEGVRLPGTVEGVTRYYQCQSNTVAEGSNSTICQINGQWSATNLYCRPNCGQPPSVDRSTVIFDGTLEGQTASYTCLQNTKTEGITTITCGNDGMWSSTNLYCRPNCGPPPTIKRAIISKGDTFEGTMRTYTCQGNTVTEGLTSITCGINGQWSKTNLYCRRKRQNSSDSSSSEEDEDSTTPRPPRQRCCRRRSRSKCCRLRRKCQSSSRCRARNVNTGNNAPNIENDDFKAEALEEIENAVEDDENDSR